MLNINFIRKFPEKVREGVKNKNVDPKFVDKFLRLDEEWRSKTSALDQLKAEQNNLSKELSQNKSEDLMSRAQVLKKRVAEVSEEMEALLKKRNAILEKMPNVPFDDVPVGKDEHENIVLREVGKK